MKVVFGERLLVDKVRALFLGESQSRREKNNELFEKGFHANKVRACSRGALGQSQSRKVFLGAPHSRAALIRLSNDLGGCE